MQNTTEFQTEACLPKFENWEGLVNMMFELKELNSIFATEEGIDAPTATGPLEEWDEELKRAYEVCLETRKNILNNSWLINLSR